MAMYSATAPRSAGNCPLTSVAPRRLWPSPVAVSRPFRRFPRRLAVEAQHRRLQRPERSRAEVQPRTRHRAPKRTLRAGESARRRRLQAALLAPVSKARSARPLGPSSAQLLRVRSAPPQALVPLPVPESRSSCRSARPLPETYRNSCKTPFQSPAECFWWSIAQAKLPKRVKLRQF